MITKQSKEEDKQEVSPGLAQTSSVTPMGCTVKQLQVLEERKPYYRCLRLHETGPATIAWDTHPHQKQKNSIKTKQKKMCKYYIIVGFLRCNILLVLFIYK